MNLVKFSFLSEGNGISNYVGHESDLVNPLKICLGIAEKDIPVKKQGNSPIYMQATAGMRMLK